jgi:hypothetical protein
VYVVGNLKVIAKESVVAGPVSYHNVCMFLDSKICFFLKFE